MIKCSATLNDAAASLSRFYHLVGLFQEAETGDGNSQTQAIKLYEQLLRQTPNWQYRQHLTALLATP
jgi:hypothetical protein